jgi:outer membrane lipopolysaccharide assembly protein LptE/RlpB
MKKILIATALLASVSLLSGCELNEPKTVETIPTEIVEST